MEISKGVGDSLCEQNLIFILFELVDERQSEIVLKSFASTIVIVQNQVIAISVSLGVVVSLPWYLVLKVLDLFPSSKPLSSALLKVFL